VRIVLAEDETLLREGLARLLTEAGFDVIGKARDAEGLLRLVDARLPDVVLTDIRMPPGHSDEGLVAAETIRDRHPQIGVLVLSHYVDARYAMRLIETFPERSGYLLKERVSDVEVLSDALRRIGDGECVVDPTIVSRLVGRGRQGGALIDLTHREREVLSLIAEGHSNASICRTLFVTPKTVEGHIRQIFTKLGIAPEPDRNRRVLAVLAFLRADH
jgi:DNA-binding NarL/FixJ family response regulator